MPIIGFVRRFARRKLLLVRLCLAVLWLLLFFHAPAIASAAKKGEFQLIGKIIFPDQDYARRGLPYIVLEGIKIPFRANTMADLSGKFKFKNLQPDLFTLVVAIPFAGESRQTVEVGPGLADSQKRVFVEVVFQPNLRSKTMSLVSSSELSIPPKALKEFTKAGDRLGKRDGDGAVAHLLKAVKIAPQYFEAWNMLGTLAYKKGKLSEAGEYFRQALKYNPEYYPAVVNLGGILLSEGKFNEALRLNLEAVRARPDDALAHSQLGLTYYYLKQNEEAEKSLKQAILLDPAHFSFPQLALADIYLGRADHDSAMRVLTQFVELHPDAAQTSAARKQIEHIRGRIR